MPDSPDLIIAFAFSLMPDGAPGAYNRRLACNLERHLKENHAATGHLPQVGVQWEIADALVDLNPRLLHELEHLDKLTLVEPPTFTDDQLDEHEFTHCLASLKTKHAQTLQGLMEETTTGSLADQLNRLLEQAKFYEHFDGTTLDNLVRPELGETFTEYRQLPQQQDYPSGLKPSQRKRINRLVIESLINHKPALARGRYLSTAGVLELIRQHMPDKDQIIQTIGVVAHSLHAPRCIAQTKSAFANGTTQPRVYRIAQDEGWPWDNSTAQVWCRSRSNWTQYENIVNRLMRQDHSGGNA